MAVSSYGSLTDSSGVVRILKDLDSSIEGKDVLIVEDIVDSGLTLNYLLRNLRARDPRSLEVCALLVKPARRKIELPIRYVGLRDTRTGSWSGTGSTWTSATATCPTWPRSTAHAGDGHLHARPGRRLTATVPGRRSRRGCRHARYPSLMIRRQSARVIALYGTNPLLGLFAAEPSDCAHAVHCLADNMSRFLKNATFPILIVVVLAFFAQRFLGQGEEKPKPNFGQFLHPGRERPGQERHDQHA